jgi:hypothetical protein
MAAGEVETWLSLVACFSGSAEPLKMSFLALKPREILLHDGRFFKVENE